jgi:hypothetical protein
MNLPKYPHSEAGIPDVDEIKSLVQNAVRYSSGKIDEFNEEAQRAVKNWNSSVEAYKNSSSSKINQDVFLKVWKLLLEPQTFEIADTTAINYQELPITSFRNLGMLSLKDELGLAFVTYGAGGYYDEALFVPVAQADKLNVNSHLYVTNSPNS